MAVAIPQFRAEPPRLPELPTIVLSAVRAAKGRERQKAATREHQRRYADSLPTGATEVQTSLIWRPQRTRRRSQASAAHGSERTEIGPPEPVPFQRCGLWPRCSGPQGNGRQPTGGHNRGQREWLYDC